MTDSRSTDGTPVARQLDPATPHWSFSNGAYIVRIDETGTTFERLTSPRCKGRILNYADYTFELGEVFFGAEGECIVGLTWLDDEPEEKEFDRIVGNFRDDMAGWTAWGSAAENKSQ